MLQLVDRMVMAPNNCMLCGCGNIADEHGKTGPYVDLGLDYNWGDSGYFCVPCASKVAALIGWVTPEDQQSFEAVIAKKDREIHDLRSKLEIVGRQKQELLNRLQRIADGSRELRRTRKAKVV